jgi:hypothetical protein
LVKVIGVLAARGARVVAAARGRTLVAPLAATRAGLVAGPGLAPEVVAVRRGRGVAATRTYAGTASRTLLGAVAVARGTPGALAPVFIARRVAGVGLVVEGGAARLVAVLAVVRLMLFAPGGQEGDASGQQAYTHSLLGSGEAAYALYCFIAQVFGRLGKLLCLVGYAGIVEPFFAAGYGLVEFVLYAGPAGGLGRRSEEASEE